MTRLAILACVLAVLAGTAQAEFYGGVSNETAARMRRMIHAWFDRHGRGYTMVCIATRESGLNPKAYNDDDWPRQSVSGLFQVAYPLWTANNPRAPASIKRFWHYRTVTWQGFRDRLSDPVQSIRLAYLLYRHSGLTPWYGRC